MVRLGHYSLVGTEAQQEVRRKALQAVINEEHGGNVSAFARRAHKAQSQIADMLAGRKSFGEKVARNIETKADLIPGILDRDPKDPNNTRSAETMIFGAPITAEAAQIGREWAKLDEPLRSQMATLILTLVAHQIREARKPPAPRPGAQASA